MVGYIYRFSGACMFVRIEGDGSHMNVITVLDAAHFTCRDADHCCSIVHLGQQILAWRADAQLRPLRHRFIHRDNKFPDSGRIPDPVIRFGGRDRYNRNARIDPRDGERTAAYLGDTGYVHITADRMDRRVFVITAYADDTQFFTGGKCFVADIAQGQLQLHRIRVRFGGGRGHPYAVADHKRCTGRKIACQIGGHADQGVSWADPGQCKLIPINRYCHRGGIGADR
ncbi:hypothetical protein SDC9_99910 [bioreactor metagenome]|uniref:Uncharacterized protein n=1 Tax=bioreactor metagenome TaxID=1076179 RepID=A0A645AIU6_9ZZZZ